MGERCGDVVEASWRRLRVWAGGMHMQNVHHARPVTATTSCGTGGYAGIEWL